MMYSFVDSIWFAFMVFNPILSLVILFNTVKITTTFNKSDVVIYPGGFWLIVIAVLVMSLLSVYFVYLSKTVTTKLGILFFSTIAPLFMLCFGLYQMYENIGWGFVT
ncbi:hypothetical protein OO007_06740 [Cocleimonas sp. KMM 6892]|uniref:hypothetical protein n=1 Tax=unclassified Cocleimonas TaxID=2639732 RepID=UPI002DBD8EC7|nr:MULTISPECIES: hypothetical protein [unclassified Cocleimonas]MEB8431920.1 hypothetical protein [Cocleimonas sp. KMM 6892]MEC4714994.1 hypothetical protein [Cocleimonas sp. KMM 6895]MEC4744192.1 hypothetical protein [Cocleimonas sp. KMM 6896]